MPEMEEEAAADQAAAERHAAKHVLDALRPTEHGEREDVRVEPPVRRLVDVVREEEREEQQRGRPQARHEREQREREEHRPEGGEHERPASPERGVKRVAPRPDHEREGQREEPLRGEDEPDESRRAR